MDLPGSGLVSLQSIFQITLRVIFSSVNLALSVPHWNSLMAPWPISIWDTQQIISLMFLKLNGTMEIQSVQQVKSSLLNEVYRTSWFDLTASPISSPFLPNSWVLFAEFYGTSDFKFKNGICFSLLSGYLLTWFPFSPLQEGYVCYGKEERLWSKTALLGILAPHFLVFKSPEMLVTVSTFQGYYKD